MQVLKKFECIQQRIFVDDFTLYHQPFMLTNTATWPDEINTATLCINSAEIDKENILEELKTLNRK